jgi:putative ABC transport system substrate-binding protein
MRALAQELVGLQPDIILTGTTAAAAAFQRETRTIPIVFAQDRHGAGPCDTAIDHAARRRGD